LAGCVALVIVGGIRSIARVTEKIVPFMALLYLAGCAVMLAMNYEALPFAVQAIWSGAFSAEGMQGGRSGGGGAGLSARGVFQRSGNWFPPPLRIRRCAPEVARPTEGLVALLEPFIDTVIICAATSLVIVTTLYYQPDFFAGARRN